MHDQLLDCNAIKLELIYIDKYHLIFTNFLTTFSNIIKDKIKSNGYSILKRYLTLYYKQLLAPI